MAQQFSQSVIREDERLLNIGLKRRLSGQTGIYAHTHIHTECSRESNERGGFSERNEGRQDISPGKRGHGDGVYVSHFPLLPACITNGIMSSSNMKSNIFHP